MVIAFFDAARQVDRARISHWLHNLGFESLSNNVMVCRRSCTIGNIRQTLARRRTEAAAEVALLRITPTALKKMDWWHWKGEES